MNLFNADLHIHSPHSISVSKALSLDTMLITCKKKGLDVLATGDILQPDWLKYIENNLQREKNGVYSYKDVNFILQTEIEDEENIHEVVLLPDFKAVRELQKKLDPHSKNLLSEWGGRPRVNISPPELVEIITDIGGVIGPAHAFTPFKAIFRQGKFSTLAECYQGALKKVSFLELGLSADTNIADRMKCLENVSFLSNSDAHSEGPTSLGREFNRFDIESPSFEEIELAINRRNGRKIVLNVGLDPRLGKYYTMFCNKCRRRIAFKKSSKETFGFLGNYEIDQDFITYFVSDPITERKRYQQEVNKGKVICPACKSELNKNFKVKLGVFERIEIISDYEKPKHPAFRPPYIDIIPLMEIIRTVKGIKSKSSKTVTRIYDEMITKLGVEFTILADLHIKDVKKYDEDIGNVIESFRNGTIEFLSGGGGTYGQIKI
jgi:uncharacterized protein (TIGR00375 family)